MKNVIFSAAAILLASCASTLEPIPTVEPELAKAYLACDKLAGSTLVDPGSAALCSITYEKLLASMPGESQREKFTAFMTWWKANKG